MVQPEPKRQSDSQTIEEQSGVRHRRQETDKSENYEKDWTRLSPGVGRLSRHKVSPGSRQVFPDCCIATSSKLKHSFLQGGGRFTRLEVQGYISPEQQLGGKRLVRVGRIIHAPVSNPTNLTDFPTEAWVKPFLWPVLRALSRGNKPLFTSLS